MFIRQNSIIETPSNFKKHPHKVIYSTQQSVESKSVLFNHFLNVETKIKIKIHLKKICLKTPKCKLTVKNFKIAFVRWIERIQKHDSNVVPLENYH